MKRSLPNRALACLTLASFLGGMLPRQARAQSEPSAPVVDVTPTQGDNLARAADALVSAPAPQKLDATDVHAIAPGDTHLGASDATLAAKGASPAPASQTQPPAEPRTTQSLPNGVETTGVSSQVLSLPQGAGKIDGMGESFSNQLSTGTATYSVPIALPGARGGADPQLALTYSTSGGHGVAGLGWDIGVPYIARQTDRGSPLYQDPATGGAWTPTQDRFVFNGGQELVPICLVGGTSCAGAQPGEVMPSWANGWQYFRPRIEGSFLRVFWSPNHQTWRVQDKNGVSMEIGAPLDGTSATGTIETDPENPGHIFRWNLSRQYDAYGAANPAAGASPLPVNVVRYEYFVDGELSYLSDVFDTPPSTSAATAPTSAFAHHAHLSYDTRTDVNTSYRRGWQTVQGLRVMGIDVTSEPFKATGSPRKLVRRYHLSYDPSYHVSLLTSVQVEGRCGAIGAGEAGEPIAEDSDGLLPATSNCPMLPAMTFGYTHVTPFLSDGSPGVADLPGYEGFDERVTTMASSPSHSIDEADTDLFDVNADGLPDVLVTMPGLYNGLDGLYLNGVTGHANAFTATTMGVQGVNGDNTGTITLDNPNVSSGDIDGDGIIDLINMPQVKTYSVYAPAPLGGSWSWVGRAVTTAAAQSPEINLSASGLNVQRMDVNGDGLVDIVASQGTEMDTFLSLDRYPGGDGQFGHASWTGATTAMLSNDPLAACVPWDGLPVQFSDPTIKIADMNGDGLPDIVRVEQGNVHYWPGHGDGYWGTASPSGCAVGSFGDDQYVAMDASPEFADPDTSAVRVDDVNGDGLDDLVVVNFTTVEVYLNVDGIGWTAAHLIANAPASPSYLSRVRLADINGSGTRDILWGDGGQYRFMDLSGGARPWMLTHVANGLGKTTDIDYAASTTLMLAAAAAGTPWTSVTPMPVEVVTQMIVGDNLSVAGNAPGEYITQYSYANPVYDGRQHEFRGFTTAAETHLGDTNSPTSNSQSQFLLGQCQDDEPLDGLPSACTPAGRWRDNVREALKGLPTAVQSFDDTGVYLSTTHHTYRLRLLYRGADGREVRHAFESEADTYLYDGAMAVGSPSTVTTSDVELELAPSPYSASEETSAPAAVATQQSGTMVLQGSAGTAHLQSATHVDVYGNTFQVIDSGCTSGCAAPDPVITRYAQPAEVSGNTGWLWRNTDTYTQGSTDIPAAVPRDRTAQTFNAQGSPLVTSKVLVGTLALARSNAGTGGVAPAPAQASSDRTVSVLTLTYDTLGNRLTSVAPNDRCRATTYDGTYAALPVTDTIDVGTVSGACGNTALSTLAAYDQGLGAVTTLTDVRGETTEVQFDGFGRIAAIFRPDPTTGVAGTLPSMTISYQLPTNPLTTPYSLVHTEVQDGATPTAQSDREAWAYVDGLGRTIVTLNQADTSAGDAAAWVATGLTTFDGKGAPKLKYLDYFYASAPTAFISTQSVGTSYAQQTYDAFGRGLDSYALDRTLALRNVYHALSVDAWDAADMAPTSGHYGTFATTQNDGHGRTVGLIERAYVNKLSQAYQTATSYESTGEPVLITRTNVGTSIAPVARWIRYDSLGRMVANVEPDATVAFTASPSGAIPAETWRYAYDDDGDLVGTSDARGCGANYAYDAGGRILSEDYSPCTSSQAAYSSTPEVSYLYDTPDPSATAGINGFAVTSTWYRGRLASTTDRAGKTLSRYDGRGRTTGIARQLVTPTGTLAPRWYVQENTLDADDRVTVEETGAVDSGAALAVTSTSTTTFSKRSLVSHVTANSWTVVASVTHDADKKPLQIVYGDVAGTTSAMSYDGRRRLSSVQTYRGPPAIWTAPPATYLPLPTYHGTTPTTFQLLLQDLDYQYDLVDNPVAIQDFRTPTEWPAGAQPVSRTMQYDDLYRLTQIAYTYPSGSDTWTPPFAAEDQGIDPDPQRATPVPQVSFAKRINAQTFAYDWLGNTTASGDDVGGFYDRSLGTITNGTASAGPYQLQAAKSTAGTSTGALTTSYDAAGNMTGLSVTRSGTCLPSGGVCSQQYAYSWDEVGRLVRAQRWDLATPGAAGTVPTTTPAASLVYAYDATDDRAIKQATDGSGNVRYTLYPLDALELRQTTWDVTLEDYDRTTATEAPYVFAQGVRLGRLALAETSDPELASGVTHLLLELPDYLGSTSIVIDHDTSELAEAASYQPYGAAESDYRPARWNSFREDYRFTGKEEDVQVGLAYFGKRFLASALNRWTSADPLAVHTLGADPNLYAYVHGRALLATDAAGLEDGPSDAGAPPAEAPPTDAGTTHGQEAALHGNTEVAGAPEPIKTLDEIQIIGERPPPRAPPRAAALLGVKAGGAYGGVFPATPFGAATRVGYDHRAALAATPVIGAAVSLGEGLADAQEGDAEGATIQFATAAVTLVADGSAALSASEKIAAASFTPMVVETPPPAPLATLGESASTDYKATFFEAHPELEGKVVVHHAVEQNVLKRYPGAVTESQMHSYENLRGIPKDMNNKLHLSLIRRSWNDFYRNNPTATTQDLLGHATKIDQQYGHLFLPPLSQPPLE